MASRSRKRTTYASDEEEERSGKRRRTVSDTLEIEDRLESLICRVGEKSTSTLESNLEGLAAVLEADLPNYKSNILKILATCAIKLPEKLTVYSTLVGLLNAKNYNFGGDFVDLLCRHLKDSLKRGNFREGWNICRFLSDLVNCHVIVAASLLYLYENFVAVCREENGSQVRADSYLYLVLASLPWVGRELYEKKENELDGLLASIDKYVKRRSKVHCELIRVWAVDDPHPQEDFIDSLWAQIVKLRQDKWIERQIHRPYMAFDNILCEALQHSIEKFTVPPHVPGFNYALPRVIFRMFDFTDVPEDCVLPGYHSIDRWIVEDMIGNIIITYALERKDCAATLLQLQFKGKLPLNYMIVETIFGQLFQLPHPPNMEIFYGSLLIELCKLQPSSMPQVLAQATEMLFERINTMNTVCIERFCTWFSYHLSNFQFRWSWEDWSDSLVGDKEMPQAKFIRETLQKCIRLSYHQRIAELVPYTAYEPLLPEKTAPDYKYAPEINEHLPGHAVAQKAVDLVKKKCTAAELLHILNELPGTGSVEIRDKEGAKNALRINVLVHILLNLGAKSFSHSFAAIAKFHATFKTLADAEDSQIWVLRSLFELWHSHPQMMAVLIDKMLRTQIVTCAAVANWIFIPSMKNEITKFYVWEILHGTISKMEKHVAKLIKELDEGKELRARKEKRDRKKEKKASKMDAGGSGDSSSSSSEDERDLDEDKLPSVEDMDRIEDRLEAAQSEQKNLFLIVFQRFIMVLTEHLASCESRGVDFMTPWFKWVLERLQNVFLEHSGTVFKYVNTLESLLFTSDVDPHILEVFQQFCALRN